MAEDSCANQSGAQNPQFDEWWKRKVEQAGTIPTVAPREAFEAGYIAAVKAHDESGCPGILADLEYGRSL